MASSASPDLKIQLMATGENSGAWGTITNDNLSALEEAIARTTDVTFAATATVSVTLSDSNALQQGRNYRLNLTGTGTAGQILLLPTVEKSYLIDNNLSVDVSVRNGTAGGTNTFNVATVGAGRSTIVYTDGSAVTSALDSASSMVVLTTLDAGGNVSVGGTLLVDGDSFTFNTASTSGTLTVGDNFSAKSTARFGGAATFDSHVSVGSTLSVVGNASIGGTLLVDGNSFTFNTASTSGTLTVGDNFSAKSTSRFGDEAIFDSVVSVGGTFHIQGNASAQGTLNVKGAVTVAATVEGTALSDGDGNLRDIPKSRTFADTTVSAAQTDTGNFIFLTSSDQTVVIPTASGTFDTGDIFSVVCAGASATISSNISLMFKVGEASATATITLGANKIASVLFVSPQHAYVSGT
jgi:hypothetical protein